MGVEEANMCDCQLDALKDNKVVGANAEGTTQRLRRWLALPENTDSNEVSHGHGERDKNANPKLLYD